MLRVLRSKWMSMGPEVRAFESEMSDFLCIKHAFAVSSGTAALHLAYQALGIGDGDEVIQPAINFVAAANATVAVGATPVFADIIGLDEPTIDPEAVERLLSPQTRAVVVMHYAGYPGRLAELTDLCARHRLALVEDACHAVGARYLDPSGRPPHGAHAGAVGDVGCFSFFSNKNMAMGEGGGFRAPMARAVIGGLITSILLTLIVVPVAYTYFDDFGSWMRRKLVSREKEEAMREEQEHAGLAPEPVWGD